MAAEKRTREPFPGVSVPLREKVGDGFDFARMVRRSDRRAIYRRPSFDSLGKPTGKFDQAEYSTRQHLALLSKGYEMFDMAEEEIHAAKQEQGLA